MNKILSKEKLDEMITNSGFSPYQFESEEEWLSIREGMLHFAGLIVKECAELVEDYVNEMSVYRADSRIKQHFGIE